MNKPVVNVVSIARANENYIIPYFSQISSLLNDNFLFGNLTIITDDCIHLTELIKKISIPFEYSIIQECNSDIVCQTLNDKVSQWATIANQGISNSLNYFSDFTLFIEADLTFPSDLIDQMVLFNLDISAPAIFLGSSFYDTWGFRDLSGSRVTSRGFENNGLPIEMSSVGSCVLFKTEIFKADINFRGPYESGLLVGVCNDSRKLGYKVWALPHISVIHPTSFWKKQTWNIINININSNRRKLTLSVNFVVPGHFPEFVAPILQSYLINIYENLNLKYFSLEKSNNERTISIDVYDEQPIGSIFYSLY